MPRVLVALRVRLSRLLDVTDGMVRHRLGISEKRMLEEDWAAQQERGLEALTQAIGRLCREAGLEAMRVRSAVCRKGTNLVIFPDRLLPGSGVVIVNSEKLPPKL